MGYIPDTKIISSTELARNFREMNEKIDNDKIDFIFRNNKPDKVIMTYDKYKLLMDYIEHLSIYNQTQREDDTEEYSIEQAFDFLNQT
jgi:PHD/YefM family antitoxin component YafN of YafNO toxin-antitoxin module